MSRMNGKKTHNTHTHRDNIIDHKKRGTLLPRDIHYVQINSSLFKLLNGVLLVVTHIERCSLFEVGLESALITLISSFRLRCRMLVGFIPEMSVGY